MHAKSGLGESKIDEKSKTYRFRALRGARGHSGDARAHVQELSGGLVHLVLFVVASWAHLGRIFGFQNVPTSG